MQRVDERSPLAGDILKTITETHTSQKGNFE
jgi:hypothetical protein